MKEIPVNVLQAGLVFSEHVYIEGENLLVPAGVEIRRRDIERLIAWGVETVWTDGHPTSDPAKTPGLVTASESGEEDSDAGAEDGERRKIREIYQDLINGLGGIFQNIAEGKPVEIRVIDEISGRLLQGVREQRNEFIGFILGGDIPGGSIAKCSINTTILSILIAMELNCPHPTILQILSGALLHDVGMLRLPRRIMEKQGGLLADELRQMHLHPFYSYRIVCTELSFPEEVGVIVRQHHERWDGMGYPQKIGGIAIELGARIVSVADAFEAMVSEKPYRNSMIGYEAMKNLLADNSCRFDPDILNAFIKTMGIYPIGSIILLNNRAVARVVDIRGDAPLRPKIRILMDERGIVSKKNEGPLIDLLADKKLFIARALDPKEILRKHE